MKEKTINIKFTKDELLALADVLDCVSGGDIDKVIDKVFGSIEDYAKNIKKIYQTFIGDFCKD